MVSLQQGPRCGVAGSKRVASVAGGRGQGSARGICGRRRGPARGICGRGRGPARGLGGCGRGSARGVRSLLRTPADSGGWGASRPEAATSFTPRGTAELAACLARRGPKLIMFALFRHLGVRPT